MASETGKKVEKTEVQMSHDRDTLRHVLKKMENKGVARMERHPRSGIGIGEGDPKAGRGGKYTWEGPGGVVGDMLDPAPPTIDEGDPNYEEDGREVEEEEGEKVVGTVEVAKVAEEERGGISRLEVVAPTNHTSASLNHKSLYD